MLLFDYTARNPQTGELVRSTVQADSEGAAAKLIAKEGFVPVEIKPSGGGSRLRKKFGNRIPAKDKVLFSRQLSTLINAGLPLLQALRSVNSQTVNKSLQTVLSQVVTDIEGGSTLANALARHPKVFNQIFISLVSAGESSGTLDKSLERLAIQQEKDADLSSKIRGALIYPIVVLLVMIAVVGFMVVKVLPAVRGLYDGMPGTHLPLLTTVLLALSDFTIHFWWLVLIIVGVLAFLTTRWARTGPGKEVIDRFKMKGWPAGSLFMKMYMARFTRTGSTLVGSGVPLLQMLDITAQAVNNIHIERAITKAAEKVKGGKALSDSIDGSDCFLPLVPNMLRIGEQSGAIEQMMSKVADYYEKEVDNEVANISSIIEPVMMVMLGIVAFIIVAAVLLPIYGLAGQSGNIGL